MCFYVSGSNKKVKVAKRDINCYKEVVIDLHSLKISRKDVYLIPTHRYNSFRYRLGVIETIKTNALIRKDFYFNENAQIGADVFHSFSNKKCLGNPYINNVNQVTINVKCTIPKGSLYLYNPYYQEYVSNQIRIDYLILNNISRMKHHIIISLLNELYQHPAIELSY